MNLKSYKKINIFFNKKVISNALTNFKRKHIVKSGSYVIINRKYYLQKALLVFK